MWSRGISEYISRHDLLRRGGFYIVALSGGADSVALLLTLHEQGYHVEAAHCNFQLRGEESVRDEEFCVALCERMGIALHRIHFDTRTYAELHHESIETVARNLRYRYFEQLRRDIGADGICVAHHRDDQVETVLLHLVRGTGLRGLQGMQPRNGHILRPLLGVSRQDILDYLKRRNQDFVTDSTNLEDDAMRNKLRLHVIPLLREINPAASDNIVRMTENVREASLLLNYALAEGSKAVAEDDGAISLHRLRQQPSPLTLLWHLLDGKGFNRQQVEEMTKAERNGAQWQSATHIALCSGDALHIIARDQWEHTLPTLRIPEEGTYIYNMPAHTYNERKAQAEAIEEEGTGEMRFRIERKAIGSDYEIDRSPRVAQLSAQRLVFPLTLRPVKDGDRFQPLGMKGSKLVSDFLADKKVPLLERHHQLVLCNGNGEIVWLVGRRISHTAAIQNDDHEIVVVSY